MKSRSVAALLFLVLFCATASAVPKLSLPAIFSDNMVLQSGTHIPIWGTAAPGENITVKYSGSMAGSTANESGKWMTYLDLSGLKGKSFQVDILGDKSAAPISIKNAIAGEVWLASGQSNMEKPVGPHIGQLPCDNWQQEVANSANPMIRMFTVATKWSDKPLDDCQGKWELASPETTAKFSAAGYFFARELNNNLKVPVGIIHSSWGGTQIQTWMSPRAFDTDPELRPLAAEDIAYYSRQNKVLADYRADIAAWAKANEYDDADNAGEKAGYADSNTATADWSPVGIGSFKAAPGIYWFRTEFDIPPACEGQNAYLWLGAIGGFDSVYLNGKRVAGIAYAQAELAAGLRKYLIPGTFIKAGHATLAIKVICHQPQSPLFKQSYQMILISMVPGQKAKFGPWVTRTQRLFPPLDDAVMKQYPTLPVLIPPFEVSTFLYNGMIHPLVPYGIAGAIWYQGESNAEIAPWAIAPHLAEARFQGTHPDVLSPLYAKLLPAMIADWRQNWSASDTSIQFPFYFCQIANYKAKTSQPSESAWAEVREAERLTLTKSPNTGMAVLIDAGEERSIHPTNKQEVGRRLALLALAGTYGQKLEASGPLYDSMSIESGRIRIKFSHTTGGLVAKALPDVYRPALATPKTVPLVKPRPGSQLQGFEIAGSDGVYHWADAVIDGNTVLVSSPDVPAPAAVRYAWADNPTCNLYNGAGLPASPFETALMPD